MAWLLCAIVLSAVTLSTSINRPVYKIALAQKGYAQFLQYDIETPPLREFTFCTWFRINDDSNDQTIFTYVVQGNNRVVRLWLDSGGRSIFVSINGVESSAGVDITKDVWRHICLSYQSDYGAWALYLDNRLLYCQSSQTLNGFVLPGGGSVIIGYGTDINGAQNGLEGEIFGANMILTSTIERNYTMKNNPHYEQKPFDRHKMKSEVDMSKYIVLSDLQTGEVNNIYNNFESARTPGINSSKSYITFSTPYSFIEHEVGVDKKTKKNVNNRYSKKFFSEPKDDIWNLNSNGHNAQDVYDAHRIESHSNSHNTPIPYGERSIEPHSHAHHGKKVFGNRIEYFSNDENTEKMIYDNKIESHLTTRHILPTISEFEVPPPVSTYNFFDKSLKPQNLPVSESIYKINEDTTERSKGFRKAKSHTVELSEVETPPPIDEQPKVYGQWTSSKFAGSVLNYLKKLQSHKKEQKKIVIPQTIPLVKTSDSYPYASEFKVIKLRPPYNIYRKNVVERQFENRKNPQINVQILEDDIRSNIIKSHALTLPKNVEISNRGISKKNQEHRFYRSVNSFEDDYDRAENKVAVKSLQLQNSGQSNQIDSSSFFTKNLLTILPFLKSLEYFIENTNTSDTQSPQISDVYTRSLSGGNKWHNVKSYSNDYTPREIKVRFDHDPADINEKIAEVNKKHPSIRLKYKHEDRKLVQYKYNDSVLLKARSLAMDVSNQSNSNRNAISILKYNHGFLPQKKNNHDSLGDEKRLSRTTKREKDNFNKHVKIGNALNERPVIGHSIEQNKKSFVGGDEKIPDINKYRDETETNGYEAVPGSLSPRVCKNVELYDRVLYVQPDESIDMTHILSPVRTKNVGVDFVVLNYKKCSLEESDLQYNVMLFIDWSKTPVRLFGGAQPKKTTDLCGFF